MGLGLKSDGHGNGGTLINGNGGRHITKSFLLECFYYLCRKCILKKLKNNFFLVTEGQAKIIIIKFLNALSKKIGDFLSKTIHSTGKPIHIILRKMLIFSYFY